MKHPLWKNWLVLTIVIALIAGSSAWWMPQRVHAQSGNFILADVTELSQFNSTSTPDSLLMKTLTPALNRGMQFPHTLETFNSLVKLHRYQGQASTIILLYGTSDPNATSKELISSLLNQNTPIMLVNHPQAKEFPKEQWEAWLLDLKHDFQKQMQQQLGKNELSVLDKALAGQTVEKDVFPQIRLAESCTLYTLPHAYMHCANGMPALRFILPKLPAAPTVQGSSASPNKPTPMPPADAQALKAIISPPPVLVDPQPNYDVSKKLIQLSGLWENYTVRQAIANRYVAFEKEADAMSTHFNVLVSDVWQRIQAFELLDKESHKIQTTQSLTQLEKQFRASAELRQAHQYGQYREQAQMAITKVLRLKQDLLFPTFPNTIHGVWFDRGSIVEAGNATNLKKRLKVLKDAGMTDIFFETINAGFPIYPNSAYQPQQNPLIHGWDPLAVAVEEGHALGMRVHAWVWCFAVGNTRHNALVGKPYSFSSPVLNLPQLLNSQLIMNDGMQLPNGQHEYWLSPASDEGQAFLNGWYREIIQRYDVDGLQLDYIRYPFQSTTQRAGYERTSQDAYSLATNKPFKSAGRSEYDAWKAENVTRFVARTSKDLKRLDPDLIISAAVFTLPYEDRIKGIQQDWETWVARDWVDWLVPMAYNDDDLVVKQQIEYIQKALKPHRTKLVSGIGAHKLTTPERMERSELLHMQGASGWVWFANKQLDTASLDLFSHSTQAVPLAGVYEAPLYKGMEVYHNVLTTVFKQPTPSELAILAAWKESIQLLKLSNGKINPNTRTQSWEPLSQQTQRALAARFGGVPALEKWLTSELTRLDAQWRYEYKVW